MLRKFRTHHKKILWVLAILIIPAFVFWGSLKDEKEEIVVKISGKPVTSDEFKQYLNIAEIYFAIFSKADKDKKFTYKDRDIKALEFLLLTWKANKERIEVNDAQVVSAIRNLEFFVREGKFDEAHYAYFLKQIKRTANITPRMFEEYIRNILKTNKLYEKHIKIEISDIDIKTLYRKDNQKAKIAYILTPYEKFKNEVSVTDKEIEDYYAKNKDNFKEEPKVKIKYAIVNQNSEVAKKIINAQTKLKTIDELKTKFSLDIKETGFISANDPIEGIGWQPMIIKLAFSLQKKKISSPLNTNVGYIFIEKEDERPARIPPIAEIKSGIEQKIKLLKQKEKAKGLCENVLKRIIQEKIKDIAKIAAQEKLDYKETDYFKYYDYIEGLGLSEKLSKLIFSLKIGSIYPYPVLLLKGACIIQLEEKTTFEEKDFIQKKEMYRQYLLQQKTVIEKMKFVSRLAKETRLQYNALPELMPQ